MSARRAQVRTRLAASKLGACWKCGLLSVGLLGCGVSSLYGATALDVAWAVVPTAALASFGATLALAHGISFVIRRITGGRASGCGCGDV